MARVTTRRAVVRIEGTETRRRTEVLAVEEPLEIRLDGVPFQVTMRTPGHDVELAHGQLFAEQVISRPEHVSRASYCGGRGPDGRNTYNVLDVRLGAGAQRPAPGLARNVVTSSACGICGTTTIDQVRRSAGYRLDPDLRVQAELVASGPALLREQQRTFDRTGGLHAAGLLDPDGRMVCVREDVGRHNALDKVIGWALLHRRLPLSRAVLCVSGRASFELTQKAVLAGIPVLVAVSAPSSLAVELADDTGLTLVGFARDGRITVYSHGDRIRVPS